jgi:ATP phosphoribosyltransferase
VPDIWLDVETMADLDDVAADFRQRHGRRLRIATKYWRLTQQFFSQKHGIQVYRIVESLGATEGAPAAGLADVIVDITTSGATLRANHLKVLGDGLVLRSQACLVASRKDRSGADEAILRDIAAKMSTLPLP